MHQHALDNTILLSLLGQLDDTGIGIVVVGFEHSLHPSGSLRLDIVVNAVGHETLNLNATNGYVDNTNLDVLGQGSHEGTSKPVGRRQSRIGTTEGRCSLTPNALLTSTLLVIDGRHQQKARPGAHQVLCLGACSALHV